jgi:hypothetical protein
VIGRPAVSRRKPNLHVFIPDPDVPPDINGLGACGACHCMGKPDDSRHRMPDLFDQDEEHRRRAGERGAA